MTDPISAPEAPVKPRTREPLLAAALAFLVPGLGHLYAGRAARGVVLALGGLVFSVGVLELTRHVHARAPRLFLALLLPAALLWIIWDAARAAARERHAFIPRRYHRWYVYAAWVVAGELLAQLGFAAIVQNVARAYQIPSTAMQPSLLQGDFILASPRPPARIRRGAVVIYGDGSGQAYVKRVVAVPGDVVEMRKKVLWLNGRPVREPYARRIDPFAAPPQEEMLWQREYLARPAAGEYAPTRDDWGPLRVPRDAYFMLGDDRDNSLDSRWLGFVGRVWIVGEPAWIYFSREPGGPTRWSRIGADVR
ncbi:MAG: signal peptidase I [Longimicrobiaceae bacterium]